MPPNTITGWPMLIHTWLNLSIPTALKWRQSRWTKMNEIPQSETGSPNPRGQNPTTKARKSGPPRIITRGIQSWKDNLDNTSELCPCIRMVYCLVYGASPSCLALGRLKPIGLGAEKCVRTRLINRSHTQNWIWLNFMYVHAYKQASGSARVLRNRKPHNVTQTRRHQNLQALQGPVISPTLSTNLPKMSSWPLSNLGQVQEMKTHHRRFSITSSLDLEGMGWSRLRKRCQTVRMEPCLCLSS